jgi:hypothetical protein
MMLLVKQLLYNIMALFDISNQEIGKQGGRL